MNRIILISGASGTGEGTVAALVAERLGVPVIVSHTTRPPREGEVDGVDYHFVDELPDDCGERSTFGGHWYGVSDADLERGGVLVATPDALGYGDVREQSKGSAVWLWANLAIRVERLHFDHSAEAVVRRMERDEASGLDSFRPPTMPPCDDPYVATIDTSDLTPERVARVICALVEEDA